MSPLRQHRSIDEAGRTPSEASIQTLRAASIGSLDRRRPDRTGGRIPPSSRNADDREISPACPGRALGSGRIISLEDAMMLDHPAVLLRHEGLDDDGRDVGPALSNTGSADRPKVAKLAGDQARAVLEEGVLHGARRGVFAVSPHDQL